MGWLNLLSCFAFIFFWWTVLSSSKFKTVYWQSVTWISVYKTRKCSKLLVLVQFLCARFLAGKLLFIHPWVFFFVFVFVFASVSVFVFVFFFVLVLIPFFLFKEGEMAKLIESCIDLVCSVDLIVEAIPWHYKYGGTLYQLELIESLFHVEIVFWTKWFQWW